MVTIVAVSLILAFIPTNISSDIDVASAHSCHNDDHDHKDNDCNGNSNNVEQGISQERSLFQNSPVVVGDECIG